MNLMYIISCDDKKVLLPGHIKNPKWRHVFITLMLPIRYSSYVSTDIITSSMHIVIMIPYKPKIRKGGVLSLMNFLDHEHNPFGSTTNFKSFDPAKNLICFTSSKTYRKM